MPADFTSDIEQLRAEIAAAAARMIAEDGADYGTAKRKAARQLLGNQRVRGDILPDNAQIEDEVRAYHEIFFGDTQPARLRHLRQLALELMQDLSPFNPYLTGAVLNGTAGEHSDIHLHLFTDNPKEVAMHLLNRHIRFEVSEAPPAGNRKQAVEMLSFLWQQEGVHLSLYLPQDLRHARKGAGGQTLERADAAAVSALLNQEQDS